MEKICGIYKITNKINQKCYIGQSVDIYNRWKKEISNSAEKYSIQYALQKYGIENFTFEILETCFPEQLNDREQYWINHYNSYNNGYNETLGGDGVQKYNYLEIVQDWHSGLTCKALAEKYQCDDGVITKALRSYGITEEIIRQRSNCNSTIPITLIEINNHKRLKTFSSCYEAARFLDIPISQVNSIYAAIRRKTKAFGYYWEYFITEDNNLPFYTKEQILSYQKLDTCITEKHKLSLSLSQRQVERPTRVELKKLIRMYSFVQIGKKYGVSDNTIRKWCDNYNLPRRVKDIKQYTDEEWEKI